MILPRRALAALAALLAAARLLAVPSVQGPVLEIPPGLKQGQILVLRLRSDGQLQGMQASLAPLRGKAAGTVLWSAAGVARGMATGEKAMIAFLAVPLGAAPGDYLLRVDALDDGQAYAAEATVSVAKRASPTMDIKLNPELTNIKASPDPRKDAESRELTALLYDRDPSADYILEPFIRPLAEKAVTATFADVRRYLYSTGGSSASVHYGIDLYDEAGTPVAAAGRGKVVMAKQRIVTGNTVVIEHAPGLYSLYYHLDRIDVSVGDMVEPGTILGALGSTGLSTGPHLHWELRLDAEPMDPECLVGLSVLSGFAKP